MGRVKWWAVLAVLAPLAFATDSGEQDRQASAAETTPTAARIAIARGKVEVEGGLVGLTAASEGIIATVPVHEGDAVRKGQVLLTLSVDAATTDVAVAKAEWQLAKVRRQAQADRLPAVRELSDRLAQAAKKGAGDPLRAEEAARTRDDVVAAIAIADAEVDLAAQRLAQADMLRSQTTLLAPRAGIIVAVRVQPGAYLAPQALPPLVLLPDRPLIVRAEVNEAFLPLVRVGDHATVTIDSQSGGDTSLRATVVRLSPIFQPPRLNEDGQSRPDVKVVDCYLEFDRPPDLRVGQGVTVSFDAKRLRAE